MGVIMDCASASEEILHSVHDVSERIRMIDTNSTGTSLRNFTGLTVAD